MTTIRINDLRLRALIGTHPWERRNKQDLILNLVIEYDARLACKSDQLKDALDYESITAQVIKTVERSRCFLLEMLAAKIARVVMAHSKVQSVFVRMDKPHAIGQARSISFEISAP